MLEPLASFVWLGCECIITGLVGFFFREEGQGVYLPIRSVCGEAREARPYTVLAPVDSRQGPGDYDTKVNVDDREILLYPAHVLSQVAQPVEADDASIGPLAARMVDLMFEANGAGLAAPQVGVLKRLFVTIDPADETASVVWINPQLTIVDETIESGIEGCLSLPGLDVSVRRAIGVHIRGLDVEGNAIEAVSSDHMARVWQHEHDHLDGRLIIDRMSTMDRLRSRRALRDLVRGND